MAISAAHYGIDSLAFPSAGVSPFFTLTGFQWPGVVVVAMTRLQLFRALETAGVRRASETAGVVAALETAGVRRG